MRYEVAEEMLNRLRAVSAQRLTEAKEAADAEPATIARLAADADLFTELRRDLFRRTPSEVEALIAEYGPLARAALETAEGHEH